MKFSTLVHLAENNDFIDGLNRYEDMNKMVFYLLPNYATPTTWATLGQLMQSSGRIASAIVKAYNNGANFNEPVFVKADAPKKDYSFKSLWVCFNKKKLNNEDNRFVFKESNEFMDGLDEYEFMNKPIYFQTGANTYKRSSVKTVGGFLNAAEFNYNKTEAKKIKEILLAKGGLQDGMLFYTINPPKDAHVFDPIRESNDFMDGVEKYDLIHKPLYFKNYDDTIDISTVYPTVKHLYEYLRTHVGQEAANTALEYVTKKGGYRHYAVNPDDL